MDSIEFVDENNELKWTQMSTAMKKNNHEHASKRQELRQSDPGTKLYSPCPLADV